MGVFENSDLNSATAPTGGGYYFESNGDKPASYEAEITRMFIRNNRGKGEMLVCETLVLESDNPGRPVGSRPSHTIVWYGKSLDVAPQNTKMLMVAAAGFSIFDPKDAKAIADEDWNAFKNDACGEDNPCKGARIHLEVLPPAAGKSYSKIYVTPGKELSELQKAARS